MLVDTHCHIHDQDTYNFAISRQQISKKLLVRHPETPHEKADFNSRNILQRAKMNGIGKIITVGTSHPDSIHARDFATKYTNVFWAYGIHPDEADGHYGQFPTSNHAKLVAIGEIGLDYRNGTDNRKRQIELLEKMLDLSINEDLPCIFHVREAFDDFFAVLDNFPKVQRAVVHSFSDSYDNLEKSLNRGFFIGINGLATFADIYPGQLPPLERTLLETDAPFLAPVPVRGHVNEPAYIRDIAEYVARRHHLELAEIAKVTTKNAKSLFKI